MAQGERGASSIRGRRRTSIARGESRAGAALARSQPLEIAQVAEMVHRTGHQPVCDVREGPVRSIFHAQAIALRTVTVGGSASG